MVSFKMWALYCLKLCSSIEISKNHWLDLWYHFLCSVSLIFLNMHWRLKSRIYCLKFVFLGLINKTKWRHLFGTESSVILQIWTDFKFLCSSYDGLDSSKKWTRWFTVNITFISETKCACSWLHSSSDFHPLHLESVLFSQPSAVTDMLSLSLRQTLRVSAFV